METAAISTDLQASSSSFPYCLYARKSTEQDELQALSIDSQIKEVLALAQQDSLAVSVIHRESHSAKASGCRPVFNAMVKEIREGKYQGILTWAPDRLARNAGDLGAVVDLMDQGALKIIRTHGQAFTNSPNDKFLLMILGSQAKLENDHKGVNVKRGLRAKCGMGWRPGVPPLGYLCNKEGVKGARKIFLDPERSPIIKEMFEKTAYHGWSGRDILEWLNQEIGFTTRKGKRVSLSMIYNMLKNPFYYGEFQYPVGTGTWYKGNHEPLISKALFQEAQERLKAPLKSKPGSKEFAFTRLLTCGGCGSGVTAEEKFKHLKDGTTKRYVYYHCDMVKKRDCGEPYIREEELIEQLLALMDTLDMDRLGVREKFKQEFARFEKFSRCLSVAGGAPETTPRLNTRQYAKYLLTDGTLPEKRELLSCLKSKLMLKDRQVTLSG